MLKSLSGNWHKVITSLCVIVEKNGVRKVYSKVFAVKVKFMKLTADMINNYLATGEYKDKAGSYGIQEKGGYFVKSPNGRLFIFYSAKAGATNLCHNYNILVFYNTE